MPDDPFSDKLLQAYDFASEIAEKDRVHHQQLRALLLSFLDVLDSFDRFFSNLGDGGPPDPEKAAGWLRTFRLIGRQVELSLRNAGVAPLTCLGQVADPDLHEIIEARAAPGTEPEVIIEEVRRGYEWNGKLLRRPQVVVAAAPKPEGP